MSLEVIISAVVGAAAGTTIIAISAFLGYRYAARYRAPLHPLSYVPPSGAHSPKPERRRCRSSSSLCRPQRRRARRDVRSHVYAPTASWPYGVGIEDGETARVGEEAHAVACAAGER